MRQLLLHCLDNFGVSDRNQVSKLPLLKKARGKLSVRRVSFVKHTGKRQVDPLVDVCTVQFICHKKVLTVQ